MMRQALIVLAALLLTACNAVVSTKPLFSDRDARGAPPLKPGVWAMLENANCAFDPANPPAQWPECADPVVFDGRVLRGPEGDKLPMAYLLAKGEPRILQLEMRDQDEPTNLETMYLYLAVEPEPGRGPITRAKAWLVQCGPPSAAGSGGRGLSRIRHRWRQVSAQARQFPVACRGAGGGRHRAVPFVPVSPHHPVPFGRGPGVRGF